MITQLICGQIDVLEACHLWQHALNDGIESVIAEEIIWKVEYF